MLKAGGANETDCISCSQVVGDTGCAGAGGNCPGRRCRRLVRAEANPFGHVDRIFTSGVHVCFRGYSNAAPGDAEILRRYRQAQLIL